MIRLLFKQFCSILIFWPFPFLTVYSQSQDSSNYIYWQEQNYLDINSFENLEKLESKTEARTFYDFKRETKLKEDTLFITLRSRFRKDRSWIDSNHDSINEIIRHESIHFDINEIIGRASRIVLQSIKLNKDNYLRKIDSVVTAEQNYWNSVNDKPFDVCVRTNYSSFCNTIWKRNVDSTLKGLSEGKEEEFYVILN